MFIKKKAIVTGGTDGIGFAIAKTLTEAGCVVAITGRTESKLSDARLRLGENVIPVLWDVSEIEKADAKINETASLLGGLDILVNNAGSFALRSEWEKETLLQTTPAEWNTVITTNTSAVFFTMQAAVKYMLKHKIEGNILNISSVAGEEPVFGAYGASKTALTALTRGWGKMFADNKITINGIAPGPVATKMNNWHDGDSLEHNRIPFGRFATADEIASLAMYLLSNESKMICGETVILDGGYSIR